LHDLVNGDECLEGLDLIGQDWLDLHGGPEGCRALVIPCVYDTTADVLSFWSSLFWTCRLFDDHGQLRLGLGHVHIAGGVERHCAGTCLYRCKKWMRFDDPW